MENQTFVEFIIDMITDEHYNTLSEDFKKEMFARMEVMYDRNIEDSYKRGHSSGYIEGLSKGIETLSKSLNK
jgi:hypothetical protein